MEMLVAVWKISDPTAVRSFIRECIRRYHDQGFDRASLPRGYLVNSNYRVKQWQRLGAGRITGWPENAPPLSVVKKPLTPPLKSLRK